jgi:hypothetical protein
MKELRLTVLFHSIKAKVLEEVNFEKKTRTVTYDTNCDLYKRSPTHSGCVVPSSRLTLAFSWDLIHLVAFKNKLLGQTNASRISILVTATCYNHNDAITSDCYKLLVLST